LGGVEINPIKFPPKTNDLGIPSVKWLCAEWIDVLQFTLNEAKSLGLSCNLIVGSGWPYGAEWLEFEERTQIVCLAVRKFKGPLDFEVSLFELFREADPAVTSPYIGRRMELISVHLVPSPLNTIQDLKSISVQECKENCKLSVGEGDFALYALVSINGFMEVINGAPGANGPVLNHYSKAAVDKFLDKMSSEVGPLAGKIRSFFTDSLELEGANWTSDMATEFEKRRGYDLLPYLPFVLLKTGAMGNASDPAYGVELGKELNETVKRIRYDFECTKTELLQERFVQRFITWCQQNKVQSRMQAYGRGYHPLDGSFGVDIPECETWIKNGLGTEMSEADYRVGRAYTMINKYVSSAAHLQGKRIISCEELTNTDRVFNETLELLKVASDQSIISGVTNAVFHGFNYSPPMADFPGWVRYGTFFNEQNPWWANISLFTTYRARLTAVFGQAEMFADIAILPPIADTWSRYGAQNEPFPSLIYPEYQTLIWESMHKNGNGCDYVSEKIIQNSVIQDGHLQFGTRKYHSLFLIKVASLEPATVRKMHDFIVGGGKILCIEECPYISSGWNNHAQRDEEVNRWMEKTKAYPDRFIMLERPEKDLTAWFSHIQGQYGLFPYVKIDRPDPFISQVYYQTKEADIFFFVNSNTEKSCMLDLTFQDKIIANKRAWLWNAETGERYILPMKGNTLNLEFAPAVSKLIVFDRTKKGALITALPTLDIKRKPLSGWMVEWRHINGTVQQTSMDELKDAKDIPEYTAFCGTILYTTDLNMSDLNAFTFINLGKVHGVSELIVNGIACGIQWYGNRVYRVADKLSKGGNTIKIKVTTTMGNYMKSLKDNPVAQYWTNEGKKNQALQSMGLLGPVIIY